MFVPATLVLRSADGKENMNKELERIWKEGVVN